MLADNIPQVIPNTQKVNCTFVLSDGVYPYDDPEDRYVVILDGEEVAWSSDYGQAQRSYLEMLGLRREHIRRNLLNRCEVAR